MMLAVAGCSRQQRSEKVAVKVNDYALTADEFNELESVDIAAANTAATIIPTAPTGRYCTMNAEKT